MKKWIFIIVLIIILFTIFGKERGINTENVSFYSYHISDDVEDGMISNPEFVYVNDIGIKIEKLKISELNLEIFLQFDMSKSFLDKYKKMEYSFCVFDDENNIYVYRNNGNSIEGIRTFCKKRNIVMDNVWGNTRESVAENNAFQIISSENNIITTYCQANAKYGFGNNGNPNEKGKMGQKIYVELWNINGEKDFDVLFEYKLPTNFYDNSMVRYKIADNKNNIKLEYASCDEYNFLLIIDIPNFYNFMNNVIKEKGFNSQYDYLYFTDEFNNRYDYDLKRGFSMLPLEKFDRIKASFNINKTNMPRILYLHTFCDNIETQIELVCENS